MRYLCALLCVWCACGSGIKRKDTRVVGRDVMASAAGDLEAMKRLVRGGVVNGGLWFDDPTCSTKFATGEIDPKLLPEFARCLVGLELAASPREDALGDVVVMNYGPGFEVEARVVQALDGPMLTWIGVEARRETDTLPTISGEALEALRTAGDRDGPLDADAISKIEASLSTTVLTPNGAQPRENSSAMTWLKVCIDATGALTAADPYVTTSSTAETVFVAAAIANWKFKPFTVRDKPIPVCAMARLVYPPGSGTQPETVPMPPPPSRGKKRPIVLATSKLLEGKRIAGKVGIAPKDLTKVEIHKAGLSIVTSTFRLCLDDNGVPESVLPMRSTGFADYDADIIAAMRQWRYSQYQVDGESVPVCTAVTFVYRQN